MDASTLYYCFFFFILIPHIDFSPPINKNVMKKSAENTSYATTHPIVPSISLFPWKEIYPPKNSANNLICAWLNHFSWDVPSKTKTFDIFWELSAWIDWYGKSLDFASGWIVAFFYLFNSWNLYWETCHWLVWIDNIPIQTDPISWKANNSFVFKRPRINCFPGRIPTS